MRRFPQGGLLHKRCDNHRAKCARWAQLTRIPNMLGCVTRLTVAAWLASPLLRRSRGFKPSFLTAPPGRCLVYGGAPAAVVVVGCRHCLAVRCPRCVFPTPYHGVCSSLSLGHARRTPSRGTGCTRRDASRLAGGFDAGPPLSGSPCGVGSSPAHRAPCSAVSMLATGCSSA